MKNLIPYSDKNKRGLEIFTLRSIIEQSIEWKTPLYINFIDFKKNFDSLLEDVTLNLISSVLLAFSWSPSWLAKWLSLSVFSCIPVSLCLDVNKAISSAKSRSSRVVKMDHVISLFESVVFLMTQSMAIRNKMGEMIQPCLTPKFTVNQSVSLLLTPMAWARLKNGLIINTKDSSKMDTSRQKTKRKTKNNLAKNHRK